VHKKRKEKHEMNLVDKNMNWLTLHGI